MRCLPFAHKSLCVSKTACLRPAYGLAILFFVTVLASCATLQTGGSYQPESVNAVRFRDRAVSKADEDVRVTVAVPTAEEARSLFDVDLINKEIQPVWVKVENHSDQAFYLLSTATDPNYFSPLEVVYALRGGLFGVYRDEMERHFREMTFQNPILPNTAVTGFIYTNLDEGEKVVQIDLIAAEQIKFFTFFVQIPGMRVDYRMVDFDSLYPKEEIVDVDEEGLREALEALPCCTSNEDGSRFGDPANLVIIGDFKTITAAFARRGWLPAEETYSTAVWKTVKSFLFGSRYRYSPVSPLFYEGRRHDFARQKPRHNIHERNHLRLWYSPLRYPGPTGIHRSGQPGYRGALHIRSLAAGHPQDRSGHRRSPLRPYRGFDLLPDAGQGRICERRWTCQAFRTKNEPDGGSLFHRRVIAP